MLSVFIEERKGKQKKKRKKKKHVPDAKSSLIWWHASNQLTRAARCVEQLLRILYGGVKIFYGGACASKGHGAMPTCAPTNQYIYIYMLLEIFIYTNEFMHPTMIELYCGICFENKTED